MVIYHGGGKYVGKLIEQSKCIYRRLFVVLFEGDDQFSFCVTAMNFHASNRGKLLLGLGGTPWAGMNDDTGNMHLEINHVRKVD